MNKPNLNTQSVLSMKGEGYYSQKTVGAKNAIDKMEVLIEEAFKNIPKVDKLRIADFGSADKITIDGLRVNFEDGWGLLRASNTTPKLVLRFEADSPKRLNEIKDMFLSQLKKIDETINIKLS